MASSAAVRAPGWVAQLAAILPPECLITQPEELRPFECDGLTLYRSRPLAVALPQTEAEVQTILRFCHQHRIPLVPRGAGTGLSGGAMPHAQGISLSLTRLNQILHIDAPARTIAVQCGVRNLAISQAVAPWGLHYAPDPSSQIACTIGGNIAENAGGVHCLKYGLTLHNVLQVRGYTAQGEPITLGSICPDDAGLSPQWLSLVMGSEGMLLVVTEATLRLTPKPETARCIMASFAAVTNAAAAVAAVIAAGMIPAGLELMDQPMVRAVEDFVHAGYDTDAAAILLCESDGTAQEVDEEIASLCQVLERSGATRMSVSQSEAERLRYWSGRKNAFPASGRLSPDYMCLDSTIPRKRLAEMLLALAQMQTRYGLRCVNVFHAGDGNLHPLILFDASDADQVARCEAFGLEILETSVRMGGSITGEHGVGVEKLTAMCAQFGSAENQFMRELKHCFDPQEGLNPAKHIPSLQRCAEFGRMRVHKGQIAFPELERL